MGKRARSTSNKRSRTFRRHAAPGTPPGTIRVDPESPRPVIHTISYGPDDLLEQEIDDPERIRALLAQWPVTWVDVDGFGDAQFLEKLGAVLGLHPLALEDVVNVHQRPKIDHYDEGLFVVVRVPRTAAADLTEQLSLFLAPRLVATFQDRGGDCFDPVRERIRKKRGKVRSAGPDHLAYALIDGVIDAYFPVVEDYGDRIEALERELLSAASADLPARILTARHELLAFRRAVSPLRDALSNLYSDELELITEETRVYLRDCYDHTLQLLDVIETYRDVASSLMEMYMSTLSNRTNDVMRVLTIITTIFMPLTFIAGIYGMNFRTDRSPLNMPELGWYFGYPFALALMAISAVILLIYFRKKGWLTIKTFQRGPDRSDLGRRE